MKNKLLIISLIGVLLAAGQSPAFALPQRPSATFTVDSTSDAYDIAPGNGICATSNGHCTLRAAIIETNMLPGADMIIVPSGTYPLTIPGVDEDDSVLGDLDIRGDLTILGVGEDQTIVDGSALDRVLEIRSPASEVNISGLTIRNGYEQDVETYPGGAGLYIHSEITVELDNIVFRGNELRYGSAVRNDGRLTINNSLITENTAGGILSGGPITATDVIVSDNLGTGIACGDKAQLTGITVAHNLPGYDYRGGSGIMLNGPNSSIEDSMVTGNHGGNGCGGIGNSGVLTITGSVVSDNFTNGYGGGGICSSTGVYIAKLVIIDSIISGNQAISGHGWSIGGGIYGPGSDVTLINSFVIGNTAEAQGGGISNSVKMYNSTVRDNVVLNGDGGGIYGYVQARDSLISHNIAQNGSGGGVYFYGQSSSVSPFLTNTTISGNGADKDGGGIYAISQYAHSTITLTNVTIIDNTADSDGNETGGGGGIFNASGEVILANSILAQNHDNSQVFKYPDCDGALSSLGYNLIQDVPTVCPISGNMTGNLIGINPLLGSLHDNGGTTLTHALIEGSPAIDAGNPSGCMDGIGTLLTTDQRGYGRPMDGDQNGTFICDMGAYEAGIQSTITPFSGGTLVYTDTQGNPTVVQLPVGAVTDTTTLTYAFLASVTLPTGFGFTQHAFELDAYQGGDRVPALAFQNPITITIQYSDADMFGLDEGQLFLMYWDGDAWLDGASTCIPPSEYGRDPGSNALSVPVCHLSRFALFGVDILKRTFLPLVVH